MNVSDRLKVLIRQVEAMERLNVQGELSTVQQFILTKIGDYLDRIDLWGPALLQRGRPGKPEDELRQLLALVEDLKRDKGIKTDKAALEWLCAHGERRVVPIKTLRNQLSQARQLSR
ncbi:hypothetical protein NVV94_05640 [Pseudomonas sp. LS1212]|uniref:hypothetical protein n=1 Tax=Pseudomonas sp. LS1212 TaxID=2972478 RepID=UPI00215BFC1D|nr:hypothetical protein [Pseudomonas sp. LS1212]UVJ45064.1 hypothetical protein NVV94_05640 [Pseudomonas sp. LS1212]